MATHSVTLNTSSRKLADRSDGEYTRPHTPITMVTGRNFNTVGSDTCRNSIGMPRNCSVADTALANAKKVPVKPDRSEESVYLRSRNVHNKNNNNAVVSNKCGRKNKCTTHKTHARGKQEILERQCDARR